MRSDNETIIVLGAGGQVGRALADVLGDRAIALDRSRADLTRIDELATTLSALIDISKNGIRAVINAAAFTQVDRAESERDVAMTVNATAPGMIAALCADARIPLVHYSTDYVFPGTGDRAWSEDDEVAPLNAYGETKLAGERAIVAAGGDALILRTSWVYDALGRNFFTTMLRLASERTALSVVADQHGAPTYAPHLASATVRALDRVDSITTFPSGIYHVCNAGTTSWHGFAREIFVRARALGIELAIEDVTPITTAEYPVPAQRPLNSRLNTTKAGRLLGIEMPDWRAGLDDCLEHYVHLQTT